MQGGDGPAIWEHIVKGVRTKHEDPGSPSPRNSPNENNIKDLTSFLNIFGTPIMTKSSYLGSGNPQEKGSQDPHSGCWARWHLAEQVAPSIG